MSSEIAPAASVAPRAAGAVRLTSVLGAVALAAVVLAAAFAIAAVAGARYGLLFLVGLGLGVTLEALRFGFAGPWRAMIVQRDPRGLLAQLLAIGLVAVIAMPLIATHGTELAGAHAPVGLAMVGAAFVFGVAMQVVLACGSGTLVNAGSGNPVAVLALPFFVLGSYLGASHLLWWTDLGTLPVIALSGPSGVAITLAGLLAVALVLRRLAAPDRRRLPARLWVAAGLVAGLALVNLVVAGQPWGVVYGLGLWGAKIAMASGADVAASGFWATPGNALRLEQSVLTDPTSLTNLGLLGGAFLVATWRQGYAQAIPRMPLRAWVAVAVAGLALGYSSRLAFGCNVGAFFSGISTGSLHGWVWFAAAFAGAWAGVRLRPSLGLETRS
ncbi:MAG: YeeE/YedE family protein [Rhodobacteraceae bacterium]|jgi:hypothetical protein|nr:YeeE/YedE family protein [Paracoccaceae bacterium]